MSSEDRKEILDYMASEGQSIWDALIEKLDYDLYLYNEREKKQQSLYGRGYSDGIRHAIKVAEEFKLIFKEVEKN